MTEDEARKLAKATLACGQANMNKAQKQAAERQLQAGLISMQRIENDQALEGRVIKMCRVSNNWVFITFEGNSYFYVEFSFDPHDDALYADYPSLTYDDITPFMLSVPGFIDKGVYDQISGLRNKSTREERRRLYEQLKEEFGDA